MTKTPLSQLEPRRVCLIKPSALGDVVQTLPVLAGLCERWPNAQFTWVINKSLAGLLDDHPQLDDVIRFDRTARGLRRWTSLVDLARRLRAGRFDLVVDMQGLLRSALMAMTTMAPRRVGFADTREALSRVAYTDRVRLPSPDLPAVTKYWHIAQALGCSGQPPAAQLGIGPELRSWAAGKWQGLSGPRLVIHPGAAWQTKRWPAAHFAEIAKRAQAEFGAGVMLVGGPGEAVLTRLIARQLSGNVLDVAEQTPLRQLAALCADTDVFVSGDSGPMHLAAAMGARIVAVFTCTSPLRAGPHGVGHRVVATRVDCAASYLKTCPTVHCMQELTPARVWPAVCAALLEALERPHRQAG